MVYFIKRSNLIKFLMENVFDVLISFIENALIFEYKKYNEWMGK